MHRIVFFQNIVTQYGVSRAFTAGLAKAFQRLGIATSVIDITKKSPADIVAELLSDRPDCTAGFNVLIEKQTHSALATLPHLALFVDTVSNFPNLLNDDHIIPAFIDEDSCGLLSTLGGPSSLFVPHAVDRDLFDPKIVELARSQIRDLDIVMSGSFINFNAIREAWELILSAKSVTLLLERAEEVMASDHLSPLQAFVECTEQGSFFEQELLEKGCNFFDLLSAFETYIRGIDRVRFLQAIEDRDIHIFGGSKYEEHWKSALAGKKLFLHPEVGFEELPSIFRRARCVVNSIPFIKRGLHERLLLALTFGASVLTNQNLFITSAFGASSAIMHVLSPHYEEANQLLEQAFSDEERRLEEALCTHPTIREHHTWDARAKMLQLALPPLLASVRKKLSVKRFGLPTFS